MKASDLTVHEFDPERGHLGIFDRRTRMFYVISVAATQTFDMGKMPGRPRGFRATEVNAGPDLEPDQMTIPGHVEPQVADLNPDDFVASESAASMFEQ